MEELNFRKSMYTIIHRTQMNAKSNFDDNTGLRAGIKRQKWYDDDQVY